MNWLDLSLKELSLKIKDGSVKPSTLAKASLERAKAYQPLYNAFVTITEESALQEAQALDDQTSEHPLFGIPYSLKDNYSTKGILTTASSNILKNYVPVYDSAVKERLDQNQSVLIGKTVLDELAMGGTSMSGHTGVVINSYSKNLDHMAGGSSGGSAVSVASGIVPFSIGSDTGDSVRKPASYCGIVGFKPSYGRISRYGLFPFAPSMDHVAFFTRTVEDSAYVLETLAGKDERDMTCLNQPAQAYAQNLSLDVKGKKVAVIHEVASSLKDPRIIALFKNAIEKAKLAGLEVETIHMDEKLLRAIYPVYMVISCAEATSNNANLDGIKFGYQMPGNSVDEQIVNTRTAGFSELIKRRFVLGSYFLKRENQDRLFIKAQKIRRLIVNQANEILSHYDGILLPAAATTAPKFKGNVTEKMSDEYLIAENHLAIGNFAGLPSITIPAGLVDEMPWGVNITGKAFAEQTVLNLAYALENQLGLKNKIVARGGK